MAKMIGIDVDGGPRKGGRKQEERRRMRVKISSDIAPRGRYLSIEQDMLSKYWQCPVPVRSNKIDLVSFARSRSNLKSSQFQPLLISA